MLHGSHVIKSWNTDQATIAPSSGEVKNHVMIKGTSQMIGLQAIMEDLGVSITGPMQINTDGSAAVGIGSRFTLAKRVSLKQVICGCRIMYVRVRLH